MEDYTDTQQAKNLTKREYFAGLAMSSILTVSEVWYIEEKDVAKWAVKYADSLINQLKTKEEQ